VTTPYPLLKTGGEFYHYSTSRNSGQALLEKKVTTPCPSEKQEGSFTITQPPEFRDRLSLKKM